MNTKDFDELVKNQNRNLPRREYSGVSAFDDEVQKLNKTVTPSIVKTPPKQPTPTAPPVPSKGPSFLSKASGFLAGAAEAPVYRDGSWKETFKNLPGEVVRTILPGAALLNDRPDLAANISNMDVAKAVPKAAFEAFVAPVASFALTFYGMGSSGFKVPGTNYKIQGTEGLGIGRAPGVKEEGEVSFNIPGLGRVTNMQARVAEDFAANGVPKSKLGTTAKVGMYTGVELLNGLFAASMAAKVVNPRPTTVAKINPEQAAALGNSNMIGQTPKTAAKKTFQLYQKPTITSPTYTKLNPTFVERLEGVGVNMSKYDSKLPTYFKFEMSANGQINGQVISIKPSWLSKFTGVFKGDIKSVPPAGVDVRYEKNIQIGKVTKSGNEAKSSVLPDVKNNVKNVTEGGVYGDIKTIQASPEYPQLLNHVKEDAMQALVNAGFKVPPELSGMTVTIENVRSIPGIVEKALNATKGVTPPVSIPIIPPVAPPISTIPSAQEGATPTKGYKSIKEYLHDNIDANGEIIKVGDIVTVETMYGSKKAVVVEIVPSETSLPGDVKTKLQEGFDVAPAFSKTGRFEKGGTLITSSDHINQGKYDDIESLMARRKQSEAQLTEEWNNADAGKAEEGSNRPAGYEPFAITPTVKDRTPFAITPTQPASIEPFIHTEDIVGTGRRLELITEDINQKIQEKADDLMDNVYNNDVAFKEQALAEAKKYVKETIEMEGKAITRPEMIVSKTQIKDMLTGLEQDVIEMKAILKDDKKYLHFKKDGNDILLKPSAIGLVEENIKIGDFLKIDVAKLKPKGTSVRAVDSSGGVMASKGSQPMSKFEQRTTTPEKSVADSFKLFEKVNQMIKKYAERVGEQYLPRGAKGVYYHGSTRNIRLTSMNELSLAAHEVSHYIDEQFNITNKLMAITGYGKDGKPIYDSATSKERKELTSLYERYYPGGKSTHKLSKRMAEGFATLVQKYVEMPTTITQNYPNLVNSILKPEGAFYNPTIGEMIRDLGQIVEDYQALSPLDQIGAVVTSDKNPTGKESFLNFWQKLRTEAADEIYPIEVLAGRAGVGMTVNDPSLWMRMYGLSNSYIINNLTGNRGYWRLKGTDLVKTNDSNWKTLLKRLDKEKTFDSFGHYLVARDQYFQFKNLEKLKEKADQLKRALRNAPEDAERELTGMADKAQKAYEELKVVLDKNGIAEATATKAFKENENRFKEEAELFDQLTREDIEFAHDDAVGLLNNEKYKEFIGKEGYAPLKREFYDDILGDAERTSNTPAGTKVSTFKGRTGSSRTILHPVESAMKAHAEITKKGLKQVVYNSIGKNIARQFPDLFQVQQLQVVPDKNTGGFIFPQEKDPNIIMAIVNGKRVPILTDKYVKGIVDDVLSFYDMHILEKVLTVMSRVFTKGTTAAYPQFLLSNITMDTVSAAIQTQTKMIPLISATKEFYKALSNSKSEEAQLLVKYLVSGGDRQVMVGYQNMSANELVAAVTKEREGLLKVIDLFDKGMDILSIPSKYSEIFTRGTEYIRSVKQGNPHIVALEHAGRVSAPFHHTGRLGGGRVGKTAVKTVPFFNPILQVLDQQARTLETPGGRQRAYFGMAILATLMAAGTASVVMQGTEKQKRMIADMDPKERSMYMYYPNPDGETLGKVRFPENWAWLGGVTSMAITDNKLKAHYSTVDYLEAATTWIPNQFKVWQFDEWIFSILPQAVKTPTLLASGKKDFPRVMDIESQGQLNKEPGLRYTDSTSALAKWMGKEFNLSPLKTDALITGLFGRASGYLTLKPSAYSIKSSLSKTEYFDSGRAMQLYYETKKENDLKTKSVKNRLREFTPEEKKETLRLDNVLSQIDTLITDYRDIDEKKYPEKAEKIKQNIYNLINEKLRGEEKTDEPLSTKEQPSRFLSLINNVLGVQTAEAAEMPKADSVSVKDLKFSENGIPYFWKDKKATDIDKITIAKKPVTPINSIKISDPRPGYSKTITDPAKLKVAEQIASISNAIAPEYTNYLLRIAQYEGTLNPKAYNDKGNNLGGVDQGLFQINTKAFPQITKAQAEDVQFATLWAIALIQAGKQDKWNADKLVKGKVKLSIT